LLEILFAILKN